MLLCAAAWTPSEITISPGFTVELEQLPEAPISQVLLSPSRQHGAGKQALEITMLPPELETQNGTALICAVLRPISAPGLNAMWHRAVQLQATNKISKKRNWL